MDNKVKRQRQNKVRREPLKSVKLRRYMQRIGNDITGRVFDPWAVEVLLKYAYNPDQIRNYLEYLRTLDNGSGELFCRSMGHNSDCVEQVRNYEEREPPDPSGLPDFEAAVERVKRRYSQAHLSMVECMSNEDVYTMVTDWGTSAGFVGLLSDVRHSSKKYAYLSNIFQNLQYVESRAKENGTFGLPIICTYRTQGSGAFDDQGNPTGTWKNKKRLVEMQGLYLVCSESRFGAPLTQFMKVQPDNTLGKRDSQILSLVNDMRANHPYWVSSDYSKWDSRLPAFLIHRAFEVIACAFDTYDRVLLETIEHDYIHKDVILWDGIHHWDKGTISGSRLTTVVNDICHEIIEEDKMALVDGLRAYIVGGDDELEAWSRPVTDDDLLLISEHIYQRYGMVLAPEKSSRGQFKSVDPTFLSRQWSVRGPYRSDGELISLLAYPETPRYKLDNEGKICNTSESKPEWVIWSYIQSYRITMEGLMDVNAFMRDTNISWNTIEWTLEQRKQVPWNVRSYVESYGLSSRIGYEQLVKNHQQANLTLEDLDFSVSL